MAGTLADLVVKVGADIKGFEVGLERIDQKLKDVGRTIEAASKDFKSPFSGIEGSLTPIFGKFDELSGKFENIGRAGRALEGPLKATGAALTGIGVAGAAGLGLAANAAIDFETAFAGVRKTVAGTPEDFAALEQQLRALALTVPISAAELANIAEIAGQLGVEKQNIAAFAETIAALGVSTNLAGEEGASALAKLINVSSATQTEVSNVGSAIVALGNSTATTEADIANIATRIGLAGTQAGLTTAEILAFGASLSSAGVSAELGGTNFSKFASTINSAVVSGGADLEGFAAVAGDSAESFRASFQDNAAGAIVAFLEGLNNVSQGGGDVAAVLDQLGFKGEETQRAILALSTRTGELKTALDTSKTAFEQNVALATEAGQRYATTESQIQLFKNGIADIAITVGQAVLPALNNLIQAVRPVIESFAQFAANNPNLTATIVAIGAALSGLALAVGPVVIAVGGLAGSLGLLLPLLGTAGLSGAFTSLTALLPSFSAAAGVASAALTGIATAAGLGAAAIGGFRLGQWAADNIPAVASLGDAMAALILKIPGLEEAFTGAAEATGGLEYQVYELEKALAAKGITVDRAGLSLIEYSKALRKAAVDGGAIKTEQQEIKKEVSAAEKAFQDQQKAAEAIAKRLADVAESTKKAKDAAKEAKPEIFKLSDAMRISTEYASGLQTATEEGAKRFANEFKSGANIASLAALNVADAVAAAGISLTNVKNPMDDVDISAINIANSLERLGVTTKAVREQELAQLQTDLGNLDAALAAGTITQDEYNAALNRIREQMGIAQTPVQQLRDELVALAGSLQDAQRNFVSTFIGTGSISEAGSAAFQTLKAAAVDALSNIANGFIDLASDRAVGALIKGIDAIIGKGPALQNILGGVLGIGGQAAGAAGTVAGAAGGAAQAGGAATQATAAVGQGLAGLVTAVSGVVTAITGVIGVFQAARQEGTLNAIELEQRQTKDLLRDQVLPALWFISDTIQFGSFVKTLENARDYLRGIAESVAFGPAVKAAEESRDFLRSIDRRLAEGLVAAGAAVALASPAAAVASFADGGKTELVDLTPVMTLVQEVSAQQLEAQAMILSGIQLQSELLAQQDASLSEYEAVSLQQGGETNALMELLLSEVASLQSPITINVNNPQFMDERQVSAVMDGIARRVRRGVRGV